MKYRRFDEIVLAFTNNLPNLKPRATIASREGRFGEKSDVFVRVTCYNYFGNQIQLIKFDHTTIPINLIFR